MLCINNYSLQLDVITGDREHTKISVYVQESVICQRCQQNERKHRLQTTDIRIGYLIEVIALSIICT